MRMRGLCVLLCVHVVLEREEMGCRILPIALLHVVCVGFFAGGGGFVGSCYHRRDPPDNPLFACLGSCGPEVLLFAGGSRHAS